MKDSKVSRRRFLSTVVSTAAASSLPLSGAAMLAGDAKPALALDDTPVKVSREAETAPPLLLSNAGYQMMLDLEKGTIASLQSTFGASRELLHPNHVRLPLFKIEFMNDRSEFKTVTSSQAKEVKLQKSGDAKEQIITIEFKEIADLPVDAQVTIRCPANETLTYWNLELNNGTDSWIGHVQFPVLEVPFDDLKDDHTNRILWSFADGALNGPVEPSMTLGSWGGRLRNRPEVWRDNNYPGQWTTTQLMAYYNDIGGLYVACDDPTGLPKFIDPMLEEDGVTLGLGHYPGTRTGKTKLPYNVVVGTFRGDWYAAAEIYRDWAAKQPFCSHKLADRRDYPKWITDTSVVGLSFPMRGQGDWDPPAAVNPEYTPATNALPHLDKLAEGFDGPLMPIVFNWEKSGPWVQPEAFPPIGGDAAMREFMAKAKQKGWHPAIYGDGLCWVTWQKNTNYDGTAYFHSQGGDDFAVHKWDGSMEQWVWDWRKNYVACVGTEKGRQMVLDMTRGMAELGADVIQQFDQGPGPKACYATNHGHPPVPGPWMTEAFNGLIQADNEVARSKNRAVAMSCEGAPPETYLQDFQIWDSRAKTCPLFSFLYHEYANGHEGLYMNRVDDGSLRLSVARALVTGYIVNFTLRDKGLIAYDWNQPWARAIPDQTAIFDWAKRTSHFRAAVARDYLVFGRMLRPWKVSNVAEYDLGWGKEPLVQSGTWQAPDGRIAVVLANYADIGQFPRVALEGQGSKKLSLYIDGERNERNLELPSLIDLDMAPRSLALIEVK